MDSLLTDVQVAQKELCDKLFGPLADLRFKYVGEELSQNLLLQRTYPAPYKAKDAMQAPTFNELRQPRDTSCLDGAVVLLRHLYSIVAIRYRADSDHSQESLCQEMQREELEHPILRFIWCDFEDADGHAAQSVVRYHIQKDIEPSQATIEHFLQSEDMVRTLWSREPFLFYHPEVVAKRREATAWRTLAYTNKPSPAKNSLVEWNGEGELGDVISDKVGMFQSSDKKTLCRYSFGQPAIIRVRYDRNSTAPNKTYGDLWSVTFNTKKLKEEPGTEQPCFIEGKDMITYNLIAIARLASADKGERQMIRLYDVFGEAIGLPVKCKNYAGAKWKLGEPNVPYLLYYAQAPPRQMPDRHGQEIAPKPDNVKSALEDIMGILR
jgi:hypothetical protein